ncbi:MAG: APC family permease [Anaerolineaceae bacterium]|nr:MAG: APC family permease [Anaerolineaceae bacterium]
MGLDKNTSSDAQLRSFSLRRMLLGDPLATSQIVHEKLSKVKALAVFSSDALSSVAYATEEILFVLVIAGSTALNLSIPIALAIATLLIIVGFSYFQTIHAYPKGGGAYIVASDNLGTVFALVAGASLLFSYILTVSVSISAGVAAITSWLPSLFPYRALFAVVAVAIVTVINQRGTSESASIFSVPTYIFIFGVFSLIIYGLIRWLFMGGLPTVEVIEVTGTNVAIQGVTLFLILRAFSAGCTALTGIEAISDGVPAFRPPEAVNAGKTLLAMIAILVLMFLGITFLANQVGAIPNQGETVLSQISRSLFGYGPLYVAVQIATALILVLAANTAFADFPRLSYFMSRDGFMPRQMGNLGDRLVYSNGITLLGIGASILILLFKGDTHSLLPMYAAGVFISFTLSQIGMVRRWVRLRSRGWLRNAIINSIGGVTTFFVFMIILITRFTQGAYIVVLLIPIIVLVLLRINKHYQQVATQLSLERYGAPHRMRNPQVIMPISGVHRGVLKALEFARSLSPDVTAVYIETSATEGEEVREKWSQWGDGVRLVCLPSPYRSILSPLIDYLQQLEAERQPDDIITVVLPQFVPARWWGNLLHNQSAWMIRLALLFRRGYIVIDVPYHLTDSPIEETT